MKKKTSKKNPPAGSVQIYPATRGVSIQGMKKPFGNGRYRHAFKGPVEIIGLANGDVLLRAPKKK